MTKFSALALIAALTAALLCFAPSAFAQGTLNRNLGGAVLSQNSAGLLVLALEPAGGEHHRVRNGCGDRSGWDRDGGGNGCNAVPEGGAAFLYLGLAGLCCLAAAIFTIRRREPASETN